MPNCALSSVRRKIAFPPLNFLSLLLRSLHHLTAPTSPFLPYFPQDHLYLPLSLPLPSAPLRVS